MPRQARCLRPEEEAVLVRANQHRRRLTKETLALFNVTASARQATSGRRYADVQRRRRLYVVF